MERVKVEIDIRKWTKEEILKKIQEIFQENKYLIMMKITPFKLTYIAMVECKPNDLNPSRRSKKQDEVL